MPTDPVVHIIDDDEAVRDSLEVLLQVLGFNVKVWSSPVAFLASEAGGEPGCLLLDIRMPEMDGLTLLGKLRTQGATIPVIVMTGHGDVPLAVRAMQNGAMNFLEKPLAKAQLLASIRAALAGLNRPPSATSANLEKLSPRELDVLRGLVTGLPNKSIAYDLGISPRTVEIHRARVMDKMSARNFSELVRLALAAGISPEDK
jgi:two-component system response regulator FixJ